MKRKPLNKTLMGFADLLSARSTCVRKKVGCIIASADLTQIYSYGYNGNARKFPNKCDSLEEGKCGCIHAEANALIKVGITDPDKIVFVTTMPCNMCAKMIVNSGASKVYYYGPYRNQFGANVFKKAGITTQRLTP